uniref:Uncharacterized protein n=1 Tax=Arundo donax TaxID=35708 RepID=A0A0A8Z5G0_ARUDO
MAPLREPPPLPPEGAAVGTRRRGSARWGFSGGRRG